MLLLSCAGRQLIHYPVRSDAGIQALANHLLVQVKEDQGVFAEKTESLIVIDPFYDADSGEVVAFTRHIEENIIQKGKENFPNFQLTRMTSDNIEKADYVINGTIRLEVFKVAGSEAYGKKYYHVAASLRNLKTGRVAGSSDVWISDQDLDYTPEPIYRDSPMYIKEKGAKDRPEGEKEELFDALKIRAVLIDGDTAYGNRNYEEALESYTKIAERIDEGIEPEQEMKTYARLYMTKYKLGHLEEAEQAFGKLIAVSVEKKHTLALKFLFDVGSVEFWKDPGLRKEYEVWLRQLGKYFAGTSYCLNIVGHCSKTGPAKMNDELSLARAKKIQEGLRPYFPEVEKRSKAIGKGFRENIVGTGTDDEQDRLDRRVELGIVDCASF
jgi:outer membrane protein OmpA-like peptidoglycan-associated protein